MKTLQLIVTLLIIFFSSTSMHKHAGNLPEGISVALTRGDSKSLANYFYANLELVLPGSEDIYSKAQAEVIVKDFFRKYPPSAFEILHEGGKSNSRSTIGNLTTNTKTFRVYILLRFYDNKPFIHQLRIEYYNE